MCTDSVPKKLSRTFLTFVKELAVTVCTVSSFRKTFAYLRFSPWTLVTCLSLEISISKTPKLIASTQFQIVHFL